MLTRRRFSAALAAATTPRLTAQTGGGRPNIVFLLTDDQRWDTLGCMGNRIIRTPHVDKLSENGVTFENHFVTTAICMTSRASIFSGLHARSHGINDFATPFSDAQYGRTYTELMRQAGYHTGFIGKYGVGNKMPSERFDFWAGFPGQGKYFLPDRTHLTETMGVQAVDFLAKAPKEKPFCLSVSFKAPHVQDEDPRQFLHSPQTASLYRDARFPLPETADPKYIAALPLEVHRSEGRRRWAVRFSTPELYQESVRAYYRLITEVDTVVGAVRRQLEAMGADRNTVIVFSSDNGFYLGEHGLAGKWLMHEESIRTPLIIHDPRSSAAQRGRRVKGMSLNIDIAPTLLSLAQLKPPLSMQGRNLMQEGPPRSEWFYEHEFTAAGWIPRTQGIRTDRWKYTAYIDTEPLFEELYDLSSDPAEKRNLAAVPSHGDQLKFLRARRAAWLKHLGSWTPAAAWSDPA